MCEAAFGKQKSLEMFCNLHVKTSPVTLESSVKAVSVAWDCWAMLSLIVKLGFGKKGVPSEQLRLWNQRHFPSFFPRKFPAWGREGEKFVLLFLRVPWCALRLAQVRRDAWENISYSSLDAQWRQMHCWVLCSPGEQTVRTGSFTLLNKWSSQPLSNKKDSHIPRREKSCILNSAMTSSLVSVLQQKQ